METEQEGCQFYLRYILDEILDEGAFAYCCRQLGKIECFLGAKQIY